MSIFSGLSLENLKIAIEAVKHSPKALAALAIIAVVAVAAIGFAGHMIAHHVGGFYARIEEEDERARREEEKEEQAAHERPPKRKKYETKRKEERNEESFSARHSAGLDARDGCRRIRHPCRTKPSEFAYAYDL